MFVFWQCSFGWHFFVLIPCTIAWVVFEGVHANQAPISVAVAQPSKPENSQIIQLLLDSGCWIMRKHVSICIDDAMVSILSLSFEYVIKIVYSDCIWTIAAKQGRVDVLHILTKHLQSNQSPIMKLQQYLFPSADSALSVSMYYDCPTLVNLSLFM